MAETQQSATIESVGNSGYHLVRFGSWEVTVRNDGMVTLPGLVRPDDIPDLCGALVAAQKVGEQQRGDNEKAQADAEAFFSKQRAAAEATEAGAQDAVATEARTAARAANRRQANAQRATSQVRRSRAGGPRAAARQPRKDAPPVTPVGKAAAKKAPAKRAAPAKKAAPAKRTPAKKAVPKKAAKR